MTLEEEAARAVSLHGPERAYRARWYALVGMCWRLHEEASRRRNAALVEATAKLAEADRYDKRALRWQRLAAWCGRRVGLSEPSTSRLLTRIDFATAVRSRAADLEHCDQCDQEGEIKW